MAGYLGIVTRGERSDYEGVSLPAWLGQVSQNELPGRKTPQRRDNEQQKHVSDNGFAPSREATQREKQLGS